MSSREAQPFRLGPYLVERELGRGGMAIVYEAVHTELARRVAIKVVNDAVRDSPTGLARFTREAKLLARLRHPHIVAATDFGTWEGRPYFVMELLEGPTLSAYLRGREGELPLADLLELFLPITAAVAAAHAASVIHRDLKPANILLARRGYRFHPTVLDFGISASLDGDEQMLTATGAVMGTVSYLSPEQTRGGQYATALSDEYAIGAMLYECATGVIPFRRESSYETMHAIVTEKLLPPSHLRGNLPPAFDAIVLRAMDRDPGRRFPSVSSLGRALRELADDRVKAIWSDELQEPTITGDAPAPGESVHEMRTEEPVAKGDNPRDNDAALRSATPAGSRRGIVWMTGLIALGVGAGALGLSSRARHEPARAPAGSVAAAVAALAGPTARLACPIFEVHGVRDVGVRLGAAAATVACARARWYLGGSDDRVLPPAALLDVPRQAVAEFPDPYVAPDTRARTVALARAGAAAYVDGVVTHASDWNVEIVLRAPDDTEIGRAEGRDAAFLPAMKKALDGSWAPPLVRRSIDPEVKRWTALPDTDFGITRTNTEILNSTEGCEAVGPRAAELGNAFFVLEGFCEATGFDAVADAGVPSIDESSAPALVTSVEAVSVSETPVSQVEARRLAEKLEAYRGAESSSFGRALLSLAASDLWSRGRESERDQGALQQALREDPMLTEAWHALVTAADRTGSASAASAIASDWFPEDTRFLERARSFRGDELPERLRDAQLATLLEPGFENALSLGRALGEAGRADEARALGASPLNDPAERRVLDSYVLGFIDLHEAKLGHAIERFEDAGDVAMIHLVVSADVIGRGSEVAKRWAKRFMSLPDDAVLGTVRGFDAPMVLCMQAPRELAMRCLDRIARLGNDGGPDQAGKNWWGDGGEALLEGARRYAAGEVAGAVSIWRPLVAGPNVDIVRLLPTEAFERAGDHDLAARLDARKMAFTMITGQSDAAPREAARAFAAGDVESARRLAQGVVTAWEVADVPVPAVTKMQELLQATRPRTQSSGPPKR